MKIDERKVLKELRAIWRNEYKEPGTSYNNARKHHRELKLVCIGDRFEEHSVKMGRISNCLGKMQEYLEDNHIKSITVQNPEKSYLIIVKYGLAVL